MSAPAGSRSNRGNPKRRAQRPKTPDEDVRGAALDLREQFMQMRSNVQENLTAYRQEQADFQQEREAFNARGTARLEAVTQAVPANGVLATGLLTAEDLEDRRDPDRQRRDAPTRDQFAVVEDFVDGTRPANEVLKAQATSEAGAALQARIEKFVATVNCKALATAASKARGGIPCIFSSNYRVGHFNLVKNVHFEDRVSWVVRLRLPPLPSVFGNREALDVPSVMQIEIATTRFLRQNTTLPIPEIFAHDLTPYNEVGAPYMFMGYIRGTPANELAAMKGLEPGTYGTPAQNDRFWRRVAEIHVELASIQFDQIGSLYEDGDEFKIGPELETGKGPWKTADDYYSNLAQHIYVTAADVTDPSVRKHESFEHIPKMFPSLMKLYGRPDQNGPFSLVNRDLGPHNLLVNDEFKIIGVIDFDGVMAAPVECVAQMPALMGMSLPPPGHVETNPLRMETLAREKPLLEKYARMFNEAADRAGSLVAKEVSRLLLCEAASVVRGLERYGGHQREVNEKWWEAYKRLWLANENEADGEDVDMRD